MAILISGSNLPSALMSMLGVAAFLRKPSLVPGHPGVGKDLLGHRG